MTKKKLSGNQRLCHRLLFRADDKDGQQLTRVKIAFLIHDRHVIISSTGSIKE